MNGNTFSGEGAIGFTHAACDPGGVLGNLLTRTVITAPVTAASATCTGRATTDEQYINILYIIVYGTNPKYSYAFSKFS